MNGFIALTDDFQDDTSKKEIDVLENKISVFKNSSTLAVLKNITVNEFLSNIENGTYKDEVLKARYYHDNDTAENYRLFKSGDSNKKIQGSVTAVSLSAHLITRAAGELNKRLKKHSGILQIDIDKLSDSELLNIKNKLELDTHTLFMFTSISGAGLKIGIKINSKYHVSNDWKEYYEQIKTYYSKLGIQIDGSCKDVVRLCYVSWDSDLFINKNSTEFKFQEIQKTVIKNDENKNKVYKFDSLNSNQNDELKTKYSTWGIQNARNIILNSTVGNRNDACLRAGVLLSGYILGGFFSIEFALSSIQDVVYLKCPDKKTKSMNDVKDGINWGSKNKSAITIESLVKDEWSEFKKVVRNSDGNIIESTGVELVRNSDGETFIIDSVFWEEIETKKGSFYLTVNYNSLYDYVKGLGVQILLLDDSELNRLLIRIENNIVSQIDVLTIQNIVMKYIESLPDQISIHKTKSDLFELFKKGIDTYISVKMYSSLKWERIEFLQDSQYNSYFFFKNGFVTISGSDVILKEYKELHGYIWRSQILNHDFTFESNSDLINNFDFTKFTKNICSVKNDDGNLLDVERYQALKNSIGYLLHNYKTTANKYAIVLTESNIDLDNSKGGTGKGLLMQAISKLRMTTTIDGKNFTFDNTFCFQNVNLETQIIFFDDVKAYFDFKRLFSTITEGLSFERKNQQRINLTPDKSPKIVISTNYSITDNSGSANRRKYEMELLCYYSDKFKPVDEFKKEFFHSWDASEYNLFYNFMFSCLTEYFKNNCKIPKYDSETKEEKKLINSTSLAFVEYADHLERNKILYTDECYSIFLEDSGETQKEVSNRKFYLWLKIYCEFKNLNFKKDLTKRDGKSTRYYYLGSVVNQRINYDDLLR